jgi:hypothetical protein
MVDGTSLGSLGRVLVGLGLLLLLAGGALILAGRIGLPLGRLPGDIALRGKHVTFYAPIATCILLSLLLSLLMWLLNHFRR